MARLSKKVFGCGCLIVIMTELNITVPPFRRSTLYSRGFRSFVITIIFFSFCTVRLHKLIGYCLTFVSEYGLKISQQHYNKYILSRVELQDLF